MRLFYKLFYCAHFESLLTRPAGRRSSRLSHSCSVQISASKAATSKLYFSQISKIWNVLPEHIVVGIFKSFCSYVSSEDFIELVTARGLSPTVTIR